MESTKQKDLPPIEPKIIECQKLFMKDLKLPAKASAIKLKFFEFHKQVYPSLQKYFPEQEGPIHELDCMLEKRVLAHAEIQNTRKLEEIYQKNIDSLLEKINLQIQRDSSSLLSFINMNIANSDNVLSLLVEQIKHVQKTPQNEVKTAEEVSGVAKLCLDLAQEYLKCLFEKYELKEYYFHKNDSLTSSFRDNLLEKCKKTFPTQAQSILKALDQFYAVFAERIETIQTASKTTAPLDININHWIGTYRSLQRVELLEFKDDVRNTLKFEPCAVFTFSYFEKINRKMEFIFEKIYNLRNDYDYIKDIVNKPLCDLFEQYYMTSERQLFDKNTFEFSDIVTIIELLILSDVGIEDPKVWETIYYSKINDLVSNVILPQLETESGAVDQIKELMVTDLKLVKENYETQGAKDAKLKEVLSKWKDIMKEKKAKIFLPTLFGACIHFSNSARDAKEKQYHPLLRKCIARLFRNFSNGEEKFTNHQLLTIMEHMIEDYQTQTLKKMQATEQEEEAKAKAKAKELSEFQKKILELAKQNNSLETAIVVQNVLELEEFTPKNYEKPNKFYIERISQVSALRSKHIIIGVSGWTSEAIKKSEYWEPLVKANPFTEIHAVHYESQNEKYVADTAISKLSNTIKTFDVKGFAANKAKWGNIVSFGMAAYDGYTKYKELLGDTWEKAYNEAIKTGTYLAHVLNEAECYKNKSISLLGFSLGTLAVSCCLWELERLGRYDLLYEVLLMGGAASTRDFMNSNLKIISNNLINCYSNNDAVLKYILRATDITSDPVGLSNISTTARNVKNHNVTDLVDGHNDFRPKMKPLLEKIDFNEDILYLLKE